MAIKSLDDLRVYQEALEAGEAVFAIISHDGFRRDPRFCDQLAQAAARVSACIGDGFGPLSDRRVAELLGDARRACTDVRACLSIARRRRYITEEQSGGTGERYARIARLLTHLIQELRTPNGMKG
jgi:four helix bundle protein